MSYYDRDGRGGRDSWRDDRDIPSSSRYSGGSYDRDRRDYGPRDQPYDPPGGGYSEDRDMPGRGHRRERPPPHLKGKDIADSSCYSDDMGRENYQSDPTSRGSYHGERQLSTNPDNYPDHPSYQCSRYSNNSNYGYTGRLNENNSIRSYSNLGREREINSMSQNYNRPFDHPNYPNEVQSRPYEDSMDQRYGRPGVRDQGYCPPRDLKGQEYVRSFGVSNQEYDRSSGVKNQEYYRPDGLRNQEYNRSSGLPNQEFNRSFGISNQEYSKYSDVPNQVCDRSSGNLSADYDRYTEHVINRRYDSPFPTMQSYDRPGDSIYQDRPGGTLRQDYDKSLSVSNQSHHAIGRELEKQSIICQSYNMQPSSNDDSYSSDEMEDYEYMSDDDDTGVPECSYNRSADLETEQRSYQRKIIDQILKKVTLGINLIEFRRKVINFKIEIHGLPTDKVSKELVVETLQGFGVRVKRIGFMFGQEQQKHYYFLNLKPEPDMISLLDVDKFCGYPVVIKESTYKPNPNAVYFNFFKIRHGKRIVLSSKLKHGPIKSVLSPSDPSNPKHAYVDRILSKIKEHKIKHKDMKNRVKNFVVTVEHDIPACAVKKSKLKAAFKPDRIYIEKLTVKSPHKFILRLRPKLDVIKILKCDKLFGYNVRITEKHDAPKDYHRFIDLIGRVIGNIG